MWSIVAHYTLIEWFQRWVKRANRIFIQIQNTHTRTSTHSLLANQIGARTILNGVISKFYAQIIRIVAVVVFFFFFGSFHNLQCKLWTNEQCLRYGWHLCAVVAIKLTFIWYILLCGVFAVRSGLYRFNTGARVTKYVYSIFKAHKLYLIHAHKHAV